MSAREDNWIMVRLKRTTKARLDAVAVRREVARQAGADIGTATDKQETADELIGRMLDHFEAHRRRRKL